MKPFCIDWEDWNENNRCNAWVATAIVGTGVLSAGASIYGANKASETQQQAAAAANAAQMDMYNRTRRDLQPYREMGTDAYGKLKDANYYTDPIKLSQEWLEKTPGYQFALSQGLKATQNSAAARGLGVSGAALKGAATFATGLADNTYMNQFNVANTNQTNAYNRLKGLVDTGQNAAAQTGNAGSNAANQVGNNLVSSSNAQGAAYMNAANNVANFANNVGGYAMYKGLYGSKPPTAAA